MNKQLESAAIIMAVGKSTDTELAKVSNNSHKGMVAFNGRPAISYLVDNIRQCDLITEVVLVSDRQTADTIGGVDHFIEACGDECGCVMAGIKAIQDAPRSLILNADMPLVSSEALSDFLTYAPDCDIVYPVVEKADVKEYFPERQAYYVQTKEGKYTGSSCLLFKPEIALKHECLLTRLLNARKAPKSLIGLLGAGFALKFMLSTLALKDFETQLTSSLGLNCRVFVSHYPELLISIDSPEDIRIIARELAG